MKCKTIIAVALSLAAGQIGSAHAQSKNNFFRGIQDIDLNISISGPGSRCGVVESDIKSSVAYILSNTPLRRINPSSAEVLSFSFIVVEATSKSDRSLGCAVTTSGELWRMVNFRGSSNYVTVWDRRYLNLADGPADMGRAVNSVVERITKEFVSEWSSQQY